MASSDTDAGELELSSEDEQPHVTSSHPVDSRSQHADNDDEAEQQAADEEETGEREEGEGDTDDTGEGEVDAAIEAVRGEEDDDNAESIKRKSHRLSLDEGGLSYASQLTHNTRAVTEQAEESRQAMKKMATFLKDKAELDRYYAKALKKLVDKAAPDPHATLTSAARSGAGSHSPTSAAAAATSSTSSSTSSFDLAMSSFRHLSLTLASNFDLFASKIDEHCLRAFSAAQQQHSRETKRLADDITRIQKQLQSLHDAHTTSKAHSKRACMDYQIWMMEHREKQRAENDRLLHSGGAAGGSGGGHGGVDSHTMFDELVASFRWDAESIKKRTLEVDNRYIAAVKALRSFKPQYDVLLKQLLASAQTEEETGRKELLEATHIYCDIQAASAHSTDIRIAQHCSVLLRNHSTNRRMFDKYVRNVRAVSAMSQQVNVRREIRAWIKQHKIPAPSTSPADRALPEYVMHKGHPRYGETNEVEEKHEHEGITDDEDESEGADDEEDGEGEEEGEEEEEDEEDEEEEDEEEDEDEDEEKTAHRRRRGKRHRRRKGGADELDESEDEKTEERIVAEKVLRVFINKTIGLKQSSSSSSASASASSASARSATPPPVDLSSPTNATLTTPLPASALLPVDPAALGDGTPIDADEEQAAKAIVSTRDGRNAFATIFSSLSPDFHASRLPKSLFFSFPADPPAAPLPASVAAAAASSPPAADRRLALSRASFNALSALTSLFLDASHATYHIEPAVFVVNIAHQIIRQPASHSASASTSAPPTLPTPTQPTTTPAVSPSDDVMRKEEVDYDSSAKPMTLLAALSLHPLLKDARFYSTALFASLHHAFAHSHLYLHRWYSDDEQEDVERARKAETLAMIGRYERMMRECGVRRRERKRFVEKQVRVFDLLGKEEWKEAVLRLMKQNERGAQTAEEEEEEEEEDEGDSPLSIEGLRELASDSEEERQNTLIKRKEEERRAMAEQKAEEKKRRKNAEGGARTTPVAAARKKREEEERKKTEEEERERKRQEDERKKQEEKKKSSASSFLAHSLSSLQSSWFAHRSPSPSPTPLPLADAATGRDRKSSGATAASSTTPPPAAAASSAAGGVGVRIPIPVAAAVPAPAHTSPGAAAKTAVAVSVKTAAAPASEAKKAETAAATVVERGEGGDEAKRKKRVAKKKRAQQDTAAPTAATTAALPPSASQTGSSQQQPVDEVDDMP